MLFSFNIYAYGWAILSFEDDSVPGGTVMSVQVSHVSDVLGDLVQASLKVLEGSQRCASIKVTDEKEACSLSLEWNDSACIVVRLGADSIMTTPAEYADGLVRGMQANTDLYLQEEWPLHSLPTAGLARLNEIALTRRTGEL